MSDSKQLLFIYAENGWNPTLEFLVDSMCSDNELGFFIHRSMALRICPELDIVLYPP